MGGFGQDPIPGYGDAAQPTSPPELTPQTAVLRLRNGPCAGREFPLLALRILLGRSDPKAGLRVDIDLTECELGSPPKISRRHAELQWADGSLRLLDLGSANGTWHNAERLPANPSLPATLAPGDQLRLADLEFELGTVA